MKNLAQIQDLMEQHNAPLWTLVFFENKYSNRPSNGGSNTHEPDSSIEKGFESLSRMVNTIAHNDQELVFQVTLKDKPSSNQGKVYGPYKFTANSSGEQSKSTAVPGLAGMNPQDFLAPHLELAGQKAKHEIANYMLERDRADFEKEKKEFEEWRKEQQALFDSKTAVAKEGFNSAIMGLLPHVAKGLGGIFGGGAPAGPLSGPPTAEEEEAEMSEDEKAIHAIGDEIIEAYTSGKIDAGGIQMIAMAVSNTIKHLTETPQ